MHDRVLADPNTSDAAKTLYTVIFRLCYLTGACTESVAGLARRTGKGKSTVRRLAGELNGRGYLWWRQTGRDNVWSILPPSLTLVGDEHTERPEVSTQSAQSRAPAIDNAGTKAFTEREQREAAAVPPTTVAAAEPAISEPDSDVADALVNRGVASYMARQIAAQVPRDRAMYVIGAIDDRRRSREVPVGRYVAALRQPERWPDYQPPLSPPPEIEQIDWNRRWDEEHAYDEWRREQAEKRITEMDPEALKAYMAEGHRLLKSRCSSYGGMTAAQRDDIAKGHVRSIVYDLLFSEGLPTFGEWLKLRKQNTTELPNSLNCPK